MVAESGAMLVDHFVIVLLGFILRIPIIESEDQYKSITLKPALTIEHINHNLIHIFRTIFKILD